MGETAMTTPQADPRQERLRQGAALGLLLTLGGVGVAASLVDTMALRLGAALGAAAAIAVSFLALSFAAKALAACAGGARPVGGDPVLKAMAVSFLLKLAVLAGGTVALHLSGQRLFHPTAYGIACASGCLLFALPATWRLATGGMR
jgi:hypothetical protein